MDDITIIVTIPVEYYKKLIQLREEMKMNSIKKEEFYKQVFIAGINFLNQQNKNS